MTISFSRPVLIVGNGWVDKNTLHEHKNNSTIIALDGGANFLRSEGIVPEVIIGDLDSVENISYWQDQGVQIVHDPDQYSTDLGKALSQIDAPFLRILGVLGDRMDHALAALAAVAKADIGSRALLIGRDDAVRYISEEECLWHLPKNRRFSVWTMQPVNFITSSGLAYPLNGLCLSPAGMIGTSNHTTHDQQYIHQETGAAGYFLLVNADDAEYLEPHRLK